jgi:hypothetical protein
MYFALAEEHMLMKYLNDKQKFLKLSTRWSILRLRNFQNLSINIQ